MSLEFALASMFHADPRHKEPSRSPATRSVHRRASECGKPICKNCAVTDAVAEFAIGEPWSCSFGTQSSSGQRTKPLVS